MVGMMHYPVHASDGLDLWYAGKVSESRPKLCKCAEALPHFHLVVFIRYLMGCIVFLRLVLGGFDVHLFRHSQEIDGVLSL